MMQYKKVFLVLRHCLRSTPSDIDLYDGKGERDLTYSIPNWNTPEYFCTEHGLDRILALGEFLKTNDEYEFNFERIVSDTEYRDADTSMALAVALGIQSVDYRPELFQSDGNICPLTNDYTLDTAARAEKRFHVLPMPADLDETLAELRGALEPQDQSNDDTPSGNHSSTTTTNSSDDSLFNDPHTRVVVDSDKNRTRLSGSVNAVKLFAQQLFYARASGISFHPEFTLPTKFTPWISYMRHILDYGTVYAAVRGTIMAQQILHAKESTIFVGHDNDIDALSTVLDINYTLPEYGLTATPPGSGLLLGVTRGGAVEIKYLYPTFHFDPANATNVTMTMNWLAVHEIRSEEDMARRVRIHLDEEYGAEVVQCFDSLDKQLKSGNFWLPMTYFAVVFIVLFACVGFRRQRKRQSVDTVNRPKRLETREEYGVVLPDMT